MALNPTSNHAPATGARTEFSVIVPLEFHRGQAVRCVREWTQNQIYPRSLYELVLVAPDGFPRRELKKLESFLAHNDQILHRSDTHDMALCVAGAQAAGGDVLFFTESHCWPEPDVLEKVEAALRLHPDWAGLSCRSVRVTHNRLSVAEADMYEAEIEYGMLHHSWRKILDQCFAVRRDAYFRAGGFEDRLGHFAEWVLAARFSRLGLGVGYVPEARVHHFYIGQLREWKVFTEDFADGQMRFHARLPHDPCEELFPQVPEWIRRQDWQHGFARGMVKLLLRKWRESKINATCQTAPVVDWRQIARWLPGATAGVAPAWFAALLQEWYLRLRLWWILRFAGREKLHAALTDYCAAIVHTRRLFFLLKQPGNTEAIAEGNADWEPGRNDIVPATRFHLVEEWCGQSFCWSEPVAMLEMRLPAGEHAVSIDWLPVRPLECPHDLRFYFNEQPLPAEQIEWKDEGVIIRLPAMSDGIAHLAWSCRSFPAPGDHRALGLPVRRISWRRIPAAAASPAA